MNDELERRIQEALDAGSAPEDTELRAALEADPEAARAARELSAVDSWLREWGAHHAGADADLESRVAARLDEALPPLDFDPLAPPAFDDDEPVAAAVPAVAAAPARSPATPVDLAARRRRRAGWWVAAAAVVGLAATGTIVGLRSGAAPEELALAAPAAEEPPAEAPRAALAPAPMPAVAQTGAREVVEAEAAGLADDQAEADTYEGARGGLGAVDGLGEPAPAAPPPRRRRVVRRRPRVAAIRGVAADESPASPALASMASQRPSGRTLARVRSCVGDDGPATLRLTAIVDTRTGRVVEVRAPGLDAETRGCLRLALRDERFAGGPREVRLRYRLRD